MERLCACGGAVWNVWQKHRTGWVGIMRGRVHWLPTPLWRCNALAYAGFLLGTDNGSRGRLPRHQQGLRRAVRYPVPVPLHRRSARATPARRSEAPASPRGRRRCRAPVRRVCTAGRGRGSFAGAGILSPRRLVMRRGIVARCAWRRSSLLDQGRAACSHAASLSNSSQEASSSVRRSAPSGAADGEVQPDHTQPVSSNPVPPGGHGTGGPGRGRKTVAARRECPARRATVGEKQGVPSPGWQPVRWPPHRGNRQQARLSGISLRQVLP